MPHLCTFTFLSHLGTLTLCPTYAPNNNIIIVVAVVAVVVVVVVVVVVILLLALI